MFDLENIETERFEVKRRTFLQLSLASTVAPLVGAAVAHLPEPKIVTPKQIVVPWVANDYKSVDMSKLRWTNRFLRAEDVEHGIYAHEGAEPSKLIHRTLFPIKGMTDAEITIIRRP